MLKIQLIGNAGDVAERRYLKDNSGNFFLELQVAVNTGSKDRKRTDWIKVNINNPKLMAVAEQYITKGTKLYIEGFPGTEGYITKEGKVVSLQKVSASTFEILSSSKATPTDSSSDDAVDPTGDTHSEDTTSTEDDIPHF